MVNAEQTNNFIGSWGLCGSLDNNKCLHAKCKMYILLVTTLYIYFITVLNAIVFVPVFSLTIRLVFMILYGVHFSHLSNKHSNFVEVVSVFNIKCLPDKTRCTRFEFFFIPGCKNAKIVSFNKNKNKTFCKAAESYSVMLTWFKITVTGRKYNGPDRDSNPGPLNI